jgi:hypothetical protein
MTSTSTFASRAQVAALFYSLLETAKLCGVEPKRYLREAALAALRGEEIPRRGARHFTP